MVLLNSVIILEFFYHSSSILLFFQGQLIGVIGKVGSGKSSLFSAVLADMVKEGGSISVASLDQGFGLATQEPWLQHATVKENILFGKSYNATWYNSVIEACALVDDLKVNVLYC